MSVASSLRSATVGLYWCSCVLILNSCSRRGFAAVSEESGDSPVKLLLDAASNRSSTRERVCHSPLKPQQAVRPTGFCVLLIRYGNSIPSPSLTLRTLVASSVEQSHHLCRLKKLPCLAACSSLSCWGSIS